MKSNSSIKLTRTGLCLDEITARIIKMESVGAKNKGKQEDKVGEGNQGVGLVMSS